MGTMFSEETRDIQSMSSTLSSSELPPESSDYPDSFDNMEVRNECSPATNQGCGEHEVCQLGIDGTYIGYLGECIKGYCYERTSQRCRGKGCTGCLTNTDKLWIIK